MGGGVHLTRGHVVTSPGHLSNYNVTRADNMLQMCTESHRNYSITAVAQAPVLQQWTVVREPYTVQPGIEEDMTYVKKKPCPSYQRFLLTCRFSLEMPGWKHMADAVFMQTRG